jgi:two-component system, OmpR family, phosphate regulon sensor histidine kinase PhoR
MKNTIFVKILIGYILIAFSLTLLISSFSYRIIKNHYLDTLRSHLSDTATAFLHSIGPMMENLELQKLDDYVNTIGQETGLRITVVSMSGKVLADSEKASSLLDDHSNRPEIITAMQGTTGEAIRFSNSVQSDMLYRAFIIDSSDGEMIGVLRLSLFLDQIELLTSRLKKEIFRISFFVLVLSFFAIYIFSLKLTRPVRELTEASKRVAEGDFEVKVLSDAKDDLGLLCLSFNSMTAKIKHLIGELTYQKTSLDKIVSSMREGLVLISSDGKIVTANDSFLKIIANPKAVGRLYWEAIKQSELHSFITRLKESETESGKKLTLNNIDYFCTGLYTENEEMLILLYDISLINKTEQLKKDIVANVSHELRSPLTAIKGFVETLENEVTSEGKEFLDIVKRNIERLNNIVSDLLTLSRLENREISEFTTVNISSVLKHVARVFREKAAKRELELITDYPDNLPEIEGDEFRIEQMVTNLIENALQHTEKGFVKISAEAGKNDIFIRIEDTGLGITTEHQNRIFERFYVVNKSRSRKYGGTGLGLAIVKHIALIHNGEVSVSSTIGKGSVFSIRLPLSKTTQ